MYVAPPRSDALCLAVGGDRGAYVVELPARGDVRVGRDAEADLTVDAPSLSRLHFVLELRDGVVTVRDLGSRNGTRKNGAPLSDAPTPMVPGDELDAGELRFTLLRRATLPASAITVALRGDTSGAVDSPAPDVPAEFRHPSLEQLHAVARRVAPRGISVLLLGETGTGKEVFAREIHRLSGRAGPFVAVNTASLPEALVESELFGHERGAFSGAVTAKAGLIEAADTGTLLLDEIGELPLPLQAKLLRVLEERAVRRVGSNTERKIDLRVIAATHQDLERQVAEKRFRADLLFRLNGVTLVLPPLRERRGEIPELARQLLARLAAPGTAPSPCPEMPALSPAALRALSNYAWPGNVRELRHVLERALAFVEGSVIELEHLPDAVTAGAAQATGPGTPTDVRSSVKDFERERILEALEKCGGNRTKAAELLGLPRRTLVYKLSKL